MTPEEYQKFKEAEKEHLRKLKELKKAYRQHSRSAKVSEALTEMATGVQELYDEHQEVVDRLHMKAATSEARMEVALDSVDIGQPDADQDALSKARAKETVRQMKLEESAGMSEDKSHGETDTGVKQEPPASPEKTIGKMKT